MDSDLLDKKNNFSTGFEFFLFIFLLLLFIVYLLFYKLLFVYLKSNANYSMQGESNENELNGKFSKRLFN